MMFRRLLGIRGIHYFATRFGWNKLKSKAFDEKYKNGAWNFETDGNGELLDIVRRYLCQGDLLIMGCGGASILKDLKTSEFSSVLGIDLSEEAIRLANRFSSKNISFQLSDMLTFECPQSFDVILFSESLNYVPVNRQKAFLNRLGKSLKPQGVIIATLAQAKRYKEMIDGVRDGFSLSEGRSFPHSTRYVMVFRPREDGSG